FPWRFGRHRAIRLEHVIERSGDAFAFTRPGVRMALVIDQLIFVANSGTTRFENEILDAAVAFRSLLPFPFEFEIVEFGVGDNVATAFTQAMEPAIFHYPAFLGESVLFEAAPAVGGLSIEQQFPPARLVFLCELA